LVGLISQYAVITPQLKGGYKRRLRASAQVFLVTMVYKTVLGFLVAL